MLLRNALKRHAISNPFNTLSRSFFNKKKCTCMNLVWLGSGGGGGGGNFNVSVQPLAPTQVLLSYTKDRWLKVFSERPGNEDKVPCPRPGRDLNRGPLVWKSMV